MKSYTTGRNLYGNWTKNTSSANLTQGDQIANDSYRQILSRRDWPFLTRERTLTTSASVQSYNLPYDTDQVQEVAVTVSSKRYVPRQVPDKAFWDRLNMSSFTSDIPEWYFTQAGKVYLWPTPATSSNTITLTVKVRVIDLSVADYTTGTIVSIANAAAAVTGSGSTWTAQMAGRYIRITYSDTANTGDGLWYEVLSVGSSTTLTLVRAYGGTTIAAGSAAYTIGQMPLLPEAFHDMPWLAAAADYWAKESDERAAYYQGKFDSLNELLDKVWSSPNTDMVIDDGRDTAIENPNLFISL